MLIEKNKNFGWVDRFTVQPAFINTDTATLNFPNWADETLFSKTGMQFGNFPTVVHLIDTTNQPFRYLTHPLPDVSPARQWKPGSVHLSGTEANRLITNTYQNFDRAFSNYLGSPSIAHWSTFGKYASREAGGQIQDMETVLKALDIFKKIDFNPFNDIKASRNLVKLIAHKNSVKQALIIAAQASGIKLSDGLDAHEIIQALRRCPRKNIQATIATIQTMRQAIVSGNTRVYEDIATAYHIFMKAESQNKNGLDALRAAGYHKAPPDGFLLEAFSSYQEARKLGQQAQSPHISKADKQLLLNKRSQLIFKANLYLGIQEQMFILQDAEVFGHPTVNKLMAEATAIMYLGIPDQELKLLPNGGNWADFSDRMGFQEVSPDTPQAIPVRHHDGTVHHYIPHPDKSKRAGSIYQLFEDYHQGYKSQILLNNQPRVL